MDVLDGRSVVSLSDAEVLPALDSVDAEITWLEEIRLQLTARIDEDGIAQDVGARDAVELVSKRYRRDRAEVWRDVRLAKALPKYTAVSTALTDGIELPTEPTTDNTDGTDGTDDRSGEGAVRGMRPMRTAHAAAIVSELERVRSRVPVEDLDVVEEQFVALAAHLSPAELRSAAREVCDLLDSDGPEPEEHKAAARESLTLTAADRGVKFRGYLANENAEALRAVVHAGARPHKTVDGEPDPRTRDKRQADALSTALTIAATAWDTNTTTPPTEPSCAPRPAPTATPAPETAETAGHAADPANGAAADPASGPTTCAAAAPATGAAGAATGEAAGAAMSGTVGGATGAAAGVAADGAAGCGAGGSGRGARLPGYGAKANIAVTIDLNDLKAATADAIGQAVYSDGLSAAAIRRLACDANVIPIVLGSNSEPLDVGRSERLVTKDIRRALNVRDRGCVVCGAPPIMCDAHHLIFWLDGGETTISNLALLCRRHHTDVHNGRWTITITDGQVHVARPTWADPPPVRRRSTATCNALQPPATPTPPKVSPTRLETSAEERADAESPTADPWGDIAAADTPSPTKADTPCNETAQSGPAQPRTALHGEALPGDARSGTAQPGEALGGTAVSETAQPGAAPSGAASPWRALSGAVVAGGRASRWRGDAATYAEAARFAVWNGGPADEPGIGPPSFATT